MTENWLEVMQQKMQLEQVIKTNEKSERFGLTLSEEEAQLIVSERKKSLQEQRRVEFGEGISPKIIDAFCDSVYIRQEDFAETIVGLQDIFYLFKNEMNDEITDDELLHFMREQFDNVCFGDLDYLETTCLDIFAQAIRAGYKEYQKDEGYGEFPKMDIVPRWDYELYLLALQNLGWE